MKRKQHGAFSGTGIRGKQPSKTKIEKETTEVVHRQRSFPKMESHYSRKKTLKKQYLAHDLNIKQMWRVYVEECKKQDLVYVKQAKYREVFVTVITIPSLMLS